MDIQYKPVKNSKYPGRPPNGCIWVRKGNSIKTNDKGEVAYRKANPSELKEKKPKVKTSKKRIMKRKATPNIDSADVKAVFLSKRAYNELTYEELVKVVEIASSKIEASRATEKAKLEKQIEKLQKRVVQL